VAEQISTCSPWKGPHFRAGGCALKDAAACGEPTPQQSDPDGLHSTDSTPAEGVLLLVGPHAGAGEEHEEEGEAETKSYKLTAAPTPHPLLPLWDRSVRSEVELGKMREWGQGVFSFVFLIVLFCYYLAIKPSPSSLVGFACDGNWRLIFLSLSWPTSFSSYFLLLSC